MAPDQPSTDSSQQTREVGLFRALILCLLAVAFVRSFVFEPFKIPSSSMLPTLMIGDHIVVSKFSFGLTIPYTKIELFRWGEPHRGDVIVFLFPKDESLHYVKRVVGIPGDRIEIHGSEIKVNGTVVERTPVQGEDGGDYFREVLDGRSHYVRYLEGGTKEWQGASSIVEVVPSDSYFVLGDNRDDSYDSRSWGYVPRANINGKAQAVLLSFDRQVSSKISGGIRWRRSGMLIH